jgi:hypothetical protein
MSNTTPDKETMERLMSNFKKYKVARAQTKDPEELSRMAKNFEREYEQARTKTSKIEPKIEVKDEHGNVVQKFQTEEDAQRWMQGQNRREYLRNRNRNRAIGRVMKKRVSKKAKKRVSKKAKKRVSKKAKKRVSKKAKKRVSKKAKKSKK